MRTPEQNANLAKLAAYLRTLPADYPDFEMTLFAKDARGFGCDEAHLPSCGTAACAAGHGPAAGIPPLKGEAWRTYSERAFISCDDNNKAEWDWCFCGSWSRVDNTAHGAAARIETLLKSGLPDDAWEQRRERSPLSYKVPA